MSIVACQGFDDVRLYNIKTLGVCPGTGLGCAGAPALDESG